ncbi:Alpha/Beta hydrolase protein [Thelonectria olida]|uniref:Carboxylic ester hydrolase n=1 Tax=Thelonectria olida TaxID=1576542 RepID=A0A9P8VXM9_9HYPO|nr:Alpha/Beta hydrolase protein [Thelonectria olida]
MPSHILKLVLTTLSSLSLSEASNRHWRHDTTPSVHLSNGTYVGLHNEQYNQDLFLGIPYAKPPTGSRRFAAPQPLTESFDEPRSATEYGWMCIGYGSDTANLGNPVSEDCLTINVVRPAGTSEDDDFPVGVWVHGGSYVNGGSRDPRYNLSYIVEQSVKENKPIVAASINYRVSYWGFMFSQEMQDAGAGNIGLRDQRMALRWIQDNIAAFGGSPEKVTIWGESAGARSLGMQLVAYDGNSDGLFRSAILESGSSVAKFVGASAWQSYFDALLAKTGCDTATDKLDCLRELPWQTLNKIWNGTNPLSVSSPTLSAVVDGDFMTGQGSRLLKDGKFARVPLLIGNNFDEGTGYAKTGINTTAQFQSYLSSIGMDSNQVSNLTTLYPDNPSVGIPSSYVGRPPAYPWGLQYKRVSAFAGDYQQHAGRRLMAKSFAGAGLPVYSYLWNVYVNGIANIYGATHFQEVAFVFDNTEGVGYSANPFEGKPATFIQLADLMSKMWVAFIHDTNPNLSSGPCSKGAVWPQYKLSQPNNLVFDVNRTNLRYIAKDNVRTTEMSYLLSNVFA